MAFGNELSSSDFGSVFTSSCVNDACSPFKCILQQSIDKHAPLITKKIKGRLCPWMSSEVKSEMNLRDQLLRKARRTNREIDWSSYKRQRNKVNGQTHPPLPKAVVTSFPLKLVFWRPKVFRFAILPGVSLSIHVRPHHLNILFLVQSPMMKSSESWEILKDNIRPAWIIFPLEC